ncbi:hypothetical protein FACS1894103_6000 [Campylobacterota bacterium]|nr:hypothetical protein FACS1894103_6000 [Campylobacterota bacterium]
MIADIEDYDRAQASLKFFAALQHGELSAAKDGWIDENDFWQKLAQSNTRVGTNQTPSRVQPTRLTSR